MEILIGLLILSAVFCFQAWHSNRLSDKSWKIMHDNYLQAMMPGMSAMTCGITPNIKTFYSQALMKRLIPSLQTADSGYAHSFIISQ